MSNRIPSVLAALAAAAICAVVVLGCGGGSDSETVSQRTSQSGAPEPGGTEQPLSPSQQHGRELFVQHCGSCHTFDAAGTVGQIGPNLDDIAVNEADVLHAIRTGGGSHSHGAGGRTGNMPRNLVTGKDAREVAAFVGRQCLRELHPVGLRPPGTADRRRPQGRVSRPPLAVIAPHCTQFDGVTWTSTVSAPLSSCSSGIS